MLPHYILPQIITMSRQLGIPLSWKGRAQKPKYQQFTGGRKKCTICGQFFSPQGFASHQKVHLIKGERSSHRAAYGKVKILGDLYPEAKSRREEERRSHEDPVILDDDSESDACHLAVNRFLDNRIRRPAGNKNNEVGNMHDEPPFKRRCLLSDEVRNVDPPSKAVDLCEVPSEPSDEEDNESAPPSALSDIDDDNGDNDDEWPPYMSEGRRNESSTNEVAGEIEVVEIIDVDAPSDAPADKAIESSERRRSVNWSPKQIVEILKAYDKRNGQANKKAFCRWVAREYNRPSYQPSTLRDWLKRRDAIELSARKKDSDRRRTAVQQQTVGQFPDMEDILAMRIRNLRSLGIVVETWMVDAEAREILYELYPTKFPDPSNTDNWGDESSGFKASSTWRKRFFKRKNFTRRKIGKRMNKKGTLPQRMEAVTAYHLRLRALQLSQINDPTYGVTSKYNVFTHDQVPIELCDCNDSTIDTTGAVEVYDAIGKDLDTKRFCTLNLYGAMELRDNRLNLPKPHLVFQATKFQTADDWHDQDERAEWDDRVVVSFQQNAWVDTRTHVHAMKEVLAPINNYLAGVEEKGLVIEDNLSSHKTDEALDFWANELENFLMPEFVPPNMTEVIQVIDRHIGILYKRAVYRAMRREIMRRLREAREAAGTAHGVTIKPMTPRERRILITRAVADEHERLSASGCYLRGFIATATWMPVWHLMDNDPMDRAPTANVSEDFEVALQHLPEYKYHEQCSRDKILPLLKKMRDEEEAVQREEARAEEEARAAREAERLAMRPYVDKAEAMMGDVMDALLPLVEKDLLTIHNETGFERFIIGGSWAAMKIVDALVDVCEEEEFEAMALEANDVDVYHGEFTEEDRKLNVKLDAICYKKVDELAVEVNTVECENLSARSLLQNNDLNITACCFSIDVSSDPLFSIQASPCFWEFVFQKGSERKIKTVNHHGQSHGPTTCIRMAYKAMRMGFAFSFGDIDVTDGTIANSQKKKIDEMFEENWTENPFLGYQCLKRKSHFVISKKHEKTKCVHCITRWAHAKCCNSMCKKCCVACGGICKVHKAK